MGRVTHVYTLIGNSSLFAKKTSVLTQGFTLQPKLASNSQGSRFSLQSTEFIGFSPMPNSACEIRFDNFRSPKIKSQNGGLSCLSRANCCCVSHFPHQPISWPALFPRGVCLLSHLTLLEGECAPHDVFASSGLPSLHRAQCHQGFCGTILQF